MKKKTGRLFRWGVGGLCILALVSAFAAACADPDNVAINEANFPDPVFRAYIKENFDKPQTGATVGDGCLDPWEIGKIERIYVYEKGISSVKGIEYLSSLRVLYMGRNNVSAIDLSKNLELETLSIDSNPLTSLDVSQNEALSYLTCSYCKIGSLDVSNCRLGTLYCSENELTSLKLGKQDDLTSLFCFGNKLTSLDVSGCRALQNLQCSDNQVGELNLSNLTKLETLNCTRLPLKKLDLSKNTALKQLHCLTTEITSLDLSASNSLEAVSAGDCSSLASLKLGNKANLVSLWAPACRKLTEIDISGCPLLDKLVRTTTPTLWGDDALWGINTGHTLDNTVCIYPGIKLITTAGVVQYQDDAVQVSEITLNKTKATLTRTLKKPAPKLQLTAEVKPENATSKEVTWASSNKKVATVDENGVVTAKGKGKATITCTAKDGSGVKAVCRVTVKNLQAKKIILNKTKATLKRGKKLTLKVKFKPADTLIQKVKWTTSNKSVATVNSKGVVKAKRKGVCTITCITQDGSKRKATCKITVK